LLFIENYSWRDGQKQFALLALAAAMAVAFGFLAAVF
jgi:hypothetical protein